MGRLEGPGSDCKRRGNKKKKKGDKGKLERGVEVEYEIY